MSDHSQSLLFALLLVPIPAFSGGYPPLGLFLFRSWFTPAFLVLSILVGGLGVLGIRLGFWSQVTGLYFLCPLFDLLVFRSAYHLWFKFQKDDPVSMVYNWAPDMAAHRALAFVTVLVPILFPVLIIGR